MGQVSEELQRIFEDQVAEVCDRIFTEGVRKMRQAIEDAGLVLTEDLKRSLYAERTFVTGELEAQFRMGMRGYGRFKDMKNIQYAGFPNIDALKEFVEEIGVEKFIQGATVPDSKGKQQQLYVPGYFIDASRRSLPDATRAKNRVAFGIAISMRNQRNRKRNTSPFYNVNRGKIYTDIVKYLTTKLPEEFLRALKEFHEKSFMDRDGYYE
ncbi:MAG: hypothetical protein U0X91_20635 [Spirosomataceae bacterium]